MHQNWSHLSCFIYCEHVCCGNCTDTANLNHGMTEGGEERREREEMEREKVKEREGGEKRKKLRERERESGRKND